MRSLVMLALTIVAAPASAQVVRGVITERESTTPITGVLVSLEHVVSGTPLASKLTSVLSDERGAFAIRAPEAGRYRLLAKRIGAKRFLSEEFSLSVGETKRIDIALDAVLLTLPTVVVSPNATSSSLCLARPDQASRVESLWDEARTALTATQVSLRDRLFQGRVTRYVRELDPKGLRVLSESRTDMSGVLSAPFRSSMSADSLSHLGYWRDQKDGSSLFFAPDADVLMSESFLKDHCFMAVDGGRDHRGMTGIAFEPAPERRIHDIRGTLWLDAKSFELRFVDFRYTQLATEDSSKVGGQVHFGRLENGAWVVRRFYIRMPQFAEYVGTPVSVDLRRPSVLVRPGIYRLIEEGGDVFAEKLRLMEKPATVVGTVVDSAGAPVPGALVRLGGTPFSAKTDSAGRFRLDSLPAGSHTIIAEHPQYAAFGMPLDDEPVSLDEGETQRVVLHAPRAEDIVLRLCDGKSPVRRRATLRLTILEDRSEVPLSQLGLWLRWKRGPSEQNVPGQVLYDGVQIQTDGKGVATFCNVPGDVPLELLVLHGDDRSVHVTDFALAPNEVTTRTVRTSRPR